MTTLLTAFMVLVLSVFNAVPTEPLVNSKPNHLALSDATKNIVPITISVPAGMDVQTATLALNDSLLAKFDKALYRYDLDMNDLSAGTYTLTFTLVNSKGVSAEGRLLLEVLLMAAPATSVTIPTAIAPSTSDDFSDIIVVRHHKGGMARSPLDAEQESSGAAEVRTPIATRIVSAPRVLMINGKSLSALMLSFAPDKGLTIAGAPSIALVESAAQSGDQPMTTQIPTAWSIPLALLLLVVVPQGVFALYWLTCIRNKRQKANVLHRSSAAVPKIVVIQDTLPAMNPMSYT